jgi:hypothetical protein
MLLAVFTAWLATRTSREVKLTKEGLALNRESIEALGRPFVVATPNDHFGLIGFIEPGPEHPAFGSPIDSGTSERARRSSPT